MSAAVVADLAIDDLAKLIRLGDFTLCTGSLSIRVQSPFGDVARSIGVLYSWHPFEIASDFADLSVEVRAPRNLRRWIRPQAEFVVEGERPFEPLARNQAPALFEWGLNWSIAASCNQWFTVHAASIERGGFAAILPAPPGSGKSTLCTALALRGWRLLSDELTLLDPVTRQAHALARPINLKNASIDLVRAFEPRRVWSPETYDTKKGRVAHLRPPAESVARMHETARPRWIVFPRYVAGRKPLLTPRAKTDTFVELAKNAFNYHTLGETAFDLIAGLRRPIATATTSSTAASTMRSRCSSGSRDESHPAPVAKRSECNETDPPSGRSGRAARRRARMRSGPAWNGTCS